jgi:hypothetical protein
MSTDLWSEQEYRYVIKKVKNHLWLYIHRGCNVKELENVVQNLTRLDKNDVELLSTVHFLLSDQVKAFVDVLPRIIRRLSHSSQKQTIVNKCFVRGRIDWSLTIKERCYRGYDPTIFVCKPNSRIFNLKENQLLKFVLTQIKRMIEETSYLSDIEEKDYRPEEIRVWKNRLSSLAFQINKALKHVHLRDVDLPKQINQRIIRRAEKLRNRDYKFVVDCYSVHNRLFEKSDINCLKELIEKRILEPLERDTLYEIFVLFEIMNSFGSPQELNLLKSDAKAVGTFKVGKTTLTIFFQKSSDLLRQSKYKDLFENYDLYVASRRPDILLRLNESNTKFIVEVKRTKNRNYIVDSVYKVLGYLADFEKEFPPGQKPKGILVVWDNIKQVKETEQDIIILTHEKITEYFEGLYCRIKSGSTSI